MSYLRLLATSTSDCTGKTRVIYCTPIQTLYSVTRPKPTWRARQRRGLCCSRPNTRTWFWDPARHSIFLLAVGTTSAPFQPLSQFHSGGRSSIFPPSSVPTSFLIFISFLSDSVAIYSKVMSVINLQSTIQHGQGAVL